MNLKETIRDVVDFPKKGIVFKDITTLLQNGEAFQEVLDLMVARYIDQKIDQIVAIESRGFIFVGALADRLKCGLILARKKGKLPSETICETYQLEYGTNTLEIHLDALRPGEKTIIVDDLLATGGTVQAVIAMVEKLKGTIEGIEFLVELEFLKGRDRLAGYPVHSIIQYPL